ncbi:DNA alkylation repair protein [Candidatus Pacearchaeota archaeon CG10_big_fil_rev_8_21_14_0_10_35_13]|nr:MAG: DNA alkylation repair protein [Candidatus Pacearchaeota archaeon CG10_big_fil_rev_8_21_14_0_10_35_13]
MIKQVIKELKSLKDKKHAILLQRFFKTGKGEYGEGDKFLGITVPEQRKIVRKYWNDTTIEELEEMLTNEYHEIRLTALLMLTARYEKKNEERKKIKELYLRNTKNINNWDLVDLSAPRIIGAWVLKNPSEKKILYEMARSKDLWKKRIAIISTAWLIKNNQYKETIELSEILLEDKHDLIHKAVGWMLRELGKKNEPALELFLEKNYKKMPRTMLRYSIEKFPEKTRKEWLKKEKINY